MLKCTAGTNKGEVTGPSTALVRLSFTGRLSGADGVHAQRLAQQCLLRGELW